MNIAAIIGILIGIIVGVLTLPTVLNSINKIEEDAIEAGTEVSAGMSAMISVLPILFIVIIVVGIIAFIFNASATEPNTTKKPKAIKKVVMKNTKEFIERVLRASEPWAEYINNLDEYLGIQTAITSLFEGLGEGQTLRYVSRPWIAGNAVHGLLLEDNILLIGGGYDWYIIDKEPDKPLFTIVGLHKKDESKNLVYCLGKRDGEAKTSLTKTVTTVLYEILTIEKRNKEGHWDTRSNPFTTDLEVIEAFHGVKIPVKYPKAEHDTFKPKVRKATYKPKYKIDKSCYQNPSGFYDGYYDSYDKIVKPMSRKSYE